LFCSRCWLSFGKPLSASSRTCCWTSPWRIEMRAITAAVVISSTALLQVPVYCGDKLTYDERVELIRGLMAEYATVKQFLPRSKKPLSFESAGTYDKKRWEEIGKEMGPAARAGDLAQITKVTLDDDKILLEINGGLRSGKHWYDRVEIGMGNR